MGLFIFFLSFLIIGLIILIGVNVKSIYDSSFTTASVIVGLVFIGLIILLCNFKTISVDEPVEIPISELSILIDDEVAIIRYKGKINTYYTASTYNAIKDTSFTFTKTIERNILGNQTSETYQLNIKN